MTTNTPFQGQSRSPISVPIESSRVFPTVVNNADSHPISQCFQLIAYHWSYFLNAPFGVEPSNSQLRQFASGNQKRCSIVWRELLRYSEPSRRGSLVRHTDRRTKWPLAINDAH